MQLLIDAGNTRVKWGWFRHSDVEHTGEWLHDNLKNAVPPADWINTPAGLSGGPDRILVANVAGESMAARIRSRTTELFGEEPEFVTVAASAHGVTNGYEDPARMGVDRWVALVGAYSLFGGPVCVVDAGTAVTVDVVDSRGLHLGGIIAPGLSLMTRSLDAATSDIGSTSTPGTEHVPLLAANTRDAVRSGALYSVASLVDRVVDHTTKRLDADPRLIVTGGDGLIVTQSARTFGEYLPNLVLRGLAVFAE